MALKAKITSEEFAKLDKFLQDHYSEKDGEYFLDVTSVKHGDSVIELADTGALKKTLQKERNRADSAEKSLGQFKDIDPEKARTALEKYEEIANWDPDKKLSEARKAMETSLQQKYDGDVIKIKKGHQQELEAIQKKYNGTRSQLENVMLSETALKAISAAKGRAKALLPIIRPHIKLQENEDGKFSVVVIDDSGNARNSTKAGHFNDPMTIDELVSEFKQDEEFSRLFEGTGSSGTGSSADRGSGSGRSSGSQLFITSADAKDPARYRAYREQAIKNGQSLEIAD